MSTTRFEKDFEYAKEDVKLPSKVAKLDPFGIKDPSKFPVPKEIQKNIREKEPLKTEKHRNRETEEREFTIIKALSPEGKEIIFALEEIKEHWLDFYEKHGIKADIPDIKLTQEQAQEVEKLIEEFGFNKAIIVPEDLPDDPKLHEKMTQGYNPTFQGEDFKKDGSFQGVKDLKTGAKIIFTKDCRNTTEDEFFKQTANLPPENPKADNDLKRFIKKIKNEKGVELEGLALSTYLIYRREYHERTQKYLDVVSRVWLIGSKMKRSGRIPRSSCYAATGGGLHVDADTLSCRVTNTWCRLAKSFELKK